MIESPIKFIPYSQESVYKTLSDLNNLERVRNSLPDQLKDISFDSDSLSCNVGGIGTLSMRITDREPCKCIKFQTEKSPIKMTLWVQLVPTAPDSCKMKLTLDPQVNALMARMLEKPLLQGIEKLAQVFASIPYNTDETV